jgi:hypothetical protein
MGKRLVRRFRSTSSINVPTSWYTYTQPKRQYPIRYVGRWEFCRHGAPAPDTRAQPSKTLQYFVRAADRGVKRRVRRNGEFLFSKDPDRLPSRVPSDWNLLIDTRSIVLVVKCKISTRRRPRFLRFSRSGRHIPFGHSGIENIASGVRSWLLMNRPVHHFRTNS